MLIINNPIRLYGRKVVTDLALRSGSVTANSFSNSTGLASMVDKMWSEPTFASKEAMFQKQVDFDADKIQPHYIEYDYAKEIEEYEYETPYNPAVDKTDFDRYYRRLEDISSEYLEKYVGNLVYTICRRSGGVKEFNYQHAVAPTILDVEDNTPSELADLETDGQKDAWSESAINEALTNLPYVLKRLGNLSRFTGIHMLSFVCSYILAKEENKLLQQAGSTKLLKRNAVIDKNVWACDRNGNATHKVEVSNKNQHAYLVFDWIEGGIDKYQAYRDDVINFMHYVRVLNVDIRENMERYGTEFLSKLVVVTLTPNTQYNPDIYRALLTGDSVASALSENAVQNTISLFSEICTTDETLKKVQSSYTAIKQKQHLEQAIKLYSAYMLSQGEFIEQRFVEFYDGYLHYDGKLAIVDANLFSTTIFKDSRCLISELGFLVHVTDSLSVHLLSIYLAYDNMLIKLGKLQDQRSEGWWLVTL